MKKGFFNNHLVIPEDIAKCVNGRKFLLANDDDSFVNIEINELSSLPSDLKIPEDQLFDISRDLVNDRMRLCVINNYLLNQHFGEHTNCDYCGGTNISHICNTCSNRAICEYCYAEIEAELKIEGGAKIIAMMSGSTRFGDRQDRILKCATNKHSIVEYSNTFRFTNLSFKSCDGCESLLYYNDYYHSEKDNLDFCIECSQRDVSRVNSVDFVKINNGRDLEVAWGFTKYGSFLDWIQIYKEESGSVLLNLNPKSEYFNNVALMAIDNHGRTGIYTCPEISYQFILDEIDKLKSQIGESRKEKGLQDDREPPIIHIIMGTMDFETYFG